jgi:hypothetical protein
LQVGVGRAQAVGSMDKFLRDTQYDTQYVFALEPYTDGTPAPTVVTKEVDMTVSAPFLLDNPDFSKTEVKEYVGTIVAPAHVLGNKISVSDIDGLKIFKFYEHPKIRALIEVMKTEFMRYQALADSIKSFEERKHNKGKDKFDLSDWWKSNSATLPGFTYVLRAVLTNSPNSCPSEHLFRIFNASYNDDQKRSYTDYIELSMQSQFNKRAL